jgi:uncharacterized spore protein YtfJ
LKQEDKSIDPIPVLDSILSHLGTSANVNVVFGEPRQVGSKTIIPIAKVSSLFGGGGGSGEKHDEDEETSRGSGGGGGGSLKVIPVAVLEVEGAQARVIPIIDVNSLLRLLLMSLTLVFVWRIVRRR